MERHIFDSKQAMGQAAAEAGARHIQHAITSKGEASIIVATGASQFDMLEALTQQDIDWSRVTGFHLDEYIGLSIEHPASFRRYLKERFVDRIPLQDFHYIDGEAEPTMECARVGEHIAAAHIDAAFVGIGENGHLAFNDPPADFNTEQPYLVVDLDEACRQQQFGEGWFDSLEAVPQQAISMSIKQIMRSAHIICTVPDTRKAAAVKNCLSGPVTPDAPASILQSHPQPHIFLDQAAASLL